MSDLLLIPLLVVAVALVGGFVYGFISALIRDLRR